jgi:murein L,D-transpeptidase YafK
MKHPVVFVLGLSTVTGLMLLADFPRETLAPDVKADRVLIIKSSRTLQLFKGSVLLKTYDIALGQNPVGRKEREGDKRTPEGWYTIDARNSESLFHRSLHISYPSPSDRAAAARSGFWPGGEIMIHGLRNGLGWIGRLHLLADWTAGCVAVTDPEIDEIWEAVPDGTPVEIRA